jgi:hypothetical protein
MISATTERTNHRSLAVIAGLPLKLKPPKKGATARFTSELRQQASPKKGRWIGGLKVGLGLHETPHKRRPNKGQQHIKNKQSK